VVRPLWHADALLQGLEHCTAAPQPPARAQERASAAEGPKCTVSSACRRGIYLQLVLSIGYYQDAGCWQLLDLLQCHKWQAMAVRSKRMCMFLIVCSLSPAAWLLGCLCSAGGIPLQELGLYTPPRRRTPTGQQQQQQTGMRIVISRPSSSSSSKPSSSAASAGSEVVDWGASIRAAWDISERGGLSLLTTFLSSSTGLAAYEAARSYADGRWAGLVSFGRLNIALRSGH
jgi:hypothetical protein